MGLFRWVLSDSLSECDGLLVRCVMERKRENRQRDKGSLTVECLLFMIPVMCAFFSLVNISRFVQAEVIIHHAITQTAKQISVYSYVMTKSGISERMINTNAKSAKFKSDIDTTTGAVSDFFSAVGGAVKGQNVQQNIDDAKNAVDLAKETVQPYLENPQEILNGVLNVLKSGVRHELMVAVVGGVARGCIKQSLSYVSSDPDAYLEKLGVVDGIDGLDFSDSKWIDNTEGKGNIEITVTYTMHNLMFPQFDFGEHQYRLCASTLTW